MNGNPYYFITIINDLVIKYVKSRYYDGKFDIKIEKKIN